MGRSETFEHTADLGLRIFASDLTDLFRTAGGALFDVIVTNRHEVRIIANEPVSLQAQSTEDLFLGWLNELIFLSETRHQLYARFDITVDETECQLDGTIGGEPIDPARHVLDHKLSRENGGWVAEVILDI
jgi:SHS2 domain-containing protein